MTRKTSELLENIREETKLEHLRQFNATIGFLNDNFRVWDLIDNKHSSCITIEGILKGNRKPRKYVLNMMGNLMLNGNKDTGLCIEDNNLIANKYIFSEQLED